MGKYFVYVLKSLKDHQLYVGYTNNLENRIKRHNGGTEKSTRYRRPFELIYFEEYFSRVEAMKREKYLKTPAGGVELKKKLGVYRGVEQSGSSSGS